MGLSQNETLCGVPGETEIIANQDRGWKGGSVVMSTCYSRRGRGFSSQLWIMLVPGDLMSWCHVWRARARAHTHTHTDTHRVNLFKNESILWTLEVNIRIPHQP
jgi:hypothetical protein